MADLFSMKNRVVLLTGASRGLGRDMAMTLAAAGATVLCAGRTVKELEVTVRADQAQEAARPRSMPLDITDEAAVREQVAQPSSPSTAASTCWSTMPASSTARAIVDTSTDDFPLGDRDRPGLAVHAGARGRPPHAGAQVRPHRQHLLDHGRSLGRASVAGYVAAKHGLIGLTKNLAAEFGPHVTANAIAPGYIRTELNVPLQQNKAFNAMLEQRTAAHRWGKPEDLRGALLLLASDAGAYITGHTLVVDGGMTTILA